MKPGKALYDHEVKERAQQAEDEHFSRCVSREKGTTHQNGKVEENRVPEELDGSVGVMARKGVVASRKEHLADDGSDEGGKKPIG